MRSLNQRLVRKAHRYLGVFIGIQFLGWTISGLYFSWNNIDSVHGDHLRKSPPALTIHEDLMSPSVVLGTVRATIPVDSIYSIRLVNLIGVPVYQVGYFSGAAADGHHAHIHYALADATSGLLRGALTRDEGIAVAKSHLISGAQVSEVRYLNSTDGHHEYRGGILPAWEVVFKYPACTAYISAEKGEFQTLRHNQWRVFDFLWMFHTMDYAGRDNFNNVLLRFFSVFALITIVSGFWLFIISSNVFRKKG